MSNSIGDLKNTGLKGNNWPWQYKVLLGLDKIAASIVTGGKEYEAELVSITCPGPTPPAGEVIRLEVRIFDSTTGSFTDVQYYEPGSTTPDPADYSACTITYLSPSAITPVSVTPNFITSVGDAATAIAVSVYSITFFNNGSVPVQVSFDAGVSFNTIPAGVSISMDAGSINNIYPANTFEYDTSTLDPAGSLIITYNS
jgi:hypothetical protein